MTCCCTTYVDTHFFLPRQIEEEEILFKKQTDDHSAMNG